MYSVTTSSPSGGGTTSGGGSFPGSSVTVTATANGGYNFVNSTVGNAGQHIAELWLYLVGGSQPDGEAATTLDTATALDAPGLTFGAAGTTSGLHRTRLTRQGWML